MTGVGGAAPVSAAIRLSTARSAIARRVATVALAMCGVSTTLGTVEQVGVHLRLALEHVEPGRGDAPLAQRRGQRRVVDDAAARDVGQRGGRLHLRQFGRADGVVRLAAEYGTTSTRWSASRSSSSLST